MNRREILATAATTPILTLPIPAYAGLSDAGKRELFQMVNYCNQYPSTQKWGCSLFANHSTKPIQELVSAGYLLQPENLSNQSSWYNWVTTEKFLDLFRI